MSEKIATREAYGKALVELGEQNKNVVVLDADLAGATMTKYFKAAHPERFFDCGIAEANMMNIGAGLSTMGLVPFCSTFAMFGAGRAYEQIRNTIAYPRFNVKICCSHAGVSVGEDGGSHQCIEDLALMRAIPGMTVICPADANEAKAATMAIAEMNGPVYMRLARLATPVFEGDMVKPFVIGKANVLREGKLTGGQTVRVLTLNTGYGGLDAGEDFFMDGGEGVRPSDAETVRQNMLGIEDLIRGADADFVMLQEVDTDSKRSYGYDQWRQYEFDLENYESRFALNYSCDYVPYPVTEPIGRVHSGVATYSRYDITAATRYRLPCPFSWPVRIANLKRCLLVTRIPIDGSEQELVLVNLHLEAYDDGEGKEAQTAMLLQILQDEYAKGNYVIAGGDFNQSFPDGTDRYPIASGADWTPGTLGDLPAGWQYAWDSAAPTCRLLNQPYSAGSSGTQFYVIDGFILSPNVEPVSVRTQDAEFAVTDHNPVVLEARLVS